MRIGNVFDGPGDAAAGVEGSMLFAGEVPDASQCAFGVGGGGRGAVAQRKVRHGSIVEVSDVGTIGPRDRLGGVEGQVGREELAFVVVILGENAVDAVVGVGDLLALGIEGRFQIRGVIVGVGDHSTVKVFRFSPS